jgi:hypothetical protein
MIPNIMTCGKREEAVAPELEEESDCTRPCQRRRGTVRSLWKPPSSEWRDDMAGSWQGSRMIWRGIYRAGENIYSAKNINNISQLESLLILLTLIICGFSCEPILMRILSATVSN